MRVLTDLVRVLSGRSVSSGAMGIGDHFEVDCVFGRNLEICSFLASFLLHPSFVYPLTLVS